MICVCNMLNYHYLSMTIGGGKNVGIQYLRAICALIVYFSHYVKAVDWNPINIFRHMRWSFIVDGSIAVSVFLCYLVFFIIIRSP